MARLGLQIGNFDAIELNEAFASQSLAVLRALGLPDDAPHVNPNGGAIALGHPLGMSGARLALTLVHQLEKTGGRRGLATLCVGPGKGVALAGEGARGGWRSSTRPATHRNTAPRTRRRHGGKGRGRKGRVGG